MYQTRVLNEKEVNEFNDKYNTNYTVIYIQKRNNKYYGIFDCDIKQSLKPKEVLNYFR